MRAYRWALLAVTILLVACAAEPAVRPPPPVTTDVSYRPVVDPAAPRYQPAPTQVAITPTMLSGNPAPDYPSSLIARNLPALAVRAKLVVAADGKVIQAIIADEATADANRRIFNAAVRQAVLHWRFEPLIMSTWKDQPDGSSKRVADQPLPFSQDYVFTFSLHDGKPLVSAGASL